METKSIPCNAQQIKKIIFQHNNQEDYYLISKPQHTKPSTTVLFLLSGFGEIPENTTTETSLHKFAFKNNIVTVFYACGNKLYADSPTVQKLNTVFTDIRNRFSLDKNNFILGGYSAGGMIALRYTELCFENPEKFPISPAGVFTVDSPIDIFTIYDALEEYAENRYSDIAVREAEAAMEVIKNEYGIPRENIPVYSNLTAFSMNKSFGQNEIHLKNTPVRTYHDVDIPWRIKNRNQTVHRSNYEVTSELINRLVLLGNTQAEFMQSYQTGFRSNGMRHPHSWSIVDEKEMMSWIKKITGSK